MVPIEITDTSNAVSARSAAPLQTKRTPVLSLKNTLQGAAAEAAVGRRAAFKHKSWKKVTHSVAITDMAALHVAKASLVAATHVVVIAQHMSEQWLTTLAGNTMLKRTRAKHLCAQTMEIGVCLHVRKMK
jgi:hypothetical protein